MGALRSAMAAATVSKGQAQADAGFSQVRPRSPLGMLDPQSSRPGGRAVVKEQTWTMRRECQ